MSGSGLTDLGTALGLVLVIEGIILALAPDLLRQVLAHLLARPSQALRVSGLASVALGVAVVWLVRG